MKLIPSEHFGRLGETMNNEEEADVTPLKSHKKRWGQKELLGRIVSRHFNIYESLSGIWPSWIVEPIEDLETSKALEELNLHLNKLDWMAKIFPEKPYVLKVLPRPRGLFILGKKQLFVFWALAFLSVWGMGVEWIGGRQENVSIFDIDTLYRSLIFYAIPLMGTLLIANLTQTYLARRNNMRIGNMIPILFPIPLPLWPFGIIAIPSHPRMDSMCWPNTKKMVAICLSGPAVILIMGTLLLILGIIISPGSFNGLNSQPLKVNPPLLIELLFSLIPNELSEGLGLYWIHPIGLAGMALTLIGWINLLPLPTLAGGRILAGLLGLDDMAKVGTQISLMALILVLGISFGFLEGNSLWTFIVIGGFMLLFLHGTDQKLPIILDESKTIDDGFSKNFASIFIILLLLLLPAKMPLEPIEDWDSELEINLDEIHYFNEEGIITYSIVNPSLLQKEIYQKFWLDSTQNITFEITCIQGEIVENCNEIKILPHSSIEITFSSKNNVTLNQSVDVIYFIEYLGLKNYHQMSFIPNTSIQSLSPRWQSNGDLISPELCTNLSNEGEEIEIFSSPHWQLDLVDNILNSGEQKVCALGEAGFPLSKNDDISNPSIYYSLNGTNYTLNLLPAKNYQLLFSPSNGWNFTNTLPPLYPFEPGNELEISTDIGFLCSNSTAHPLMGSSDYIHWNATSSSSRKLLPPVINGTLAIELPKNGFMIACDRDDPFESDLFSIKEGPDILVNGTNSEIIRGNVPLWDIAKCINNCTSTDSIGLLNFSLYSLNENVTISTRFHGNIIPWEINSDLSLISENETNVSISWDLGLDEDVFLMAWLDYNSNNLEIHLTAWSGVN